MKRIYIFVMIWLVSSVAAIAIDQTLLLRLLELQRESYIAKRGEVNLDFVPSYSQDNSLVPWSLTKSSTVAMSLNLRIGLSNKVEASLRLPYSSINRKVYASGWTNYFGAGLGDPTMSLQLEILPERYNRPATYLNLGTTLPLARSSFDNPGPFDITQSNGCFTLYSGVSMLKSIDPAVLYGGFDYQLNLKRGSYDPADLLNYNFGLGWALNQNVSLSYGLSGAIVGADQQTIAGIEQPITTGFNRAALYLGSTIIFSRDLYINPNVSIGLTAEDTDFIFSLGVTQKLKEAR